MEYVVAFIIAIIGSILMFELYAWLSNFCAWLARKAAKHMPDGHELRFEEEWLAYLDEMPNSLAHLTAALGFWAAVIKLWAPIATAAWLGQYVAAPLLRFQYFTLKSYMKICMPALEEVKKELTRTKDKKYIVEGIDFAIKYYPYTLRKYALVILSLERGNIQKLSSTEIVGLCCTSAILSTKITGVRAISKYPVLLNMYHRLKYRKPEMNG